MNAPGDTSERVILIISSPAKNIATTRGKHDRSKLEQQSRDELYHGLSE